jgi:hypothetical protein
VGKGKEVMKRQGGVGDVNRAGERGGGRREVRERVEGHSP